MKWQSVSFSSSIVCLPVGHSVCLPVCPSFDRLIGFVVCRRSGQTKKIICHSLSSNSQTRVNDGVMTFMTDYIARFHTNPPSPTEFIGSVREQPRIWCKVLNHHNVISYVIILRLQFWYVHETILIVTKLPSNALNMAYINVAGSHVIRVKSEKAACKKTTEL